MSDEESDEVSGGTSSTTSYRHRKSSPIEDPKQHHYGSFYLRMGAVGMNYFLVLQLAQFWYLHGFLRNS